MNCSAVGHFYFFKYVELACLEVNESLIALGTSGFMVSLKSLLTSSGGSSL